MHSHFGDEPPSECNCGLQDKLKDQSSQVVDVEMETHMVELQTLHQYF